MEQKCQDEVEQSGWLIFNKRKIHFKKTELIDECNIQSIQQLPEKICFPKKSDQLVIDDKGIKSKSSYFSWANIVATGVKIETVPMEYMDDHRISILIGLTDEQIIELPVINNIEYRTEIGHLIELYKRKFRKRY